MTGPGSGLEQGHTFVGLELDGAELVLVREDGTRAVVPNVLIAKGSVSAGPGGTVKLELTEGE